MSDDARSAPDLYAVKRVPLAEIGRTFLWFGLLGFGGPAAHLALMERELVARRKWLSHEHFLDMLAAINLVPGPNSTEMAFHIGLATGGLPGMLLAGAGFILPAVVLSVSLAMVYVAAGSAPAIQGLLIGVKPVVLVLILSAAYRLGKAAINSRLMAALAALALVVVALGSAPLMGLLGLSPISAPELAILLATGLLYVLLRRRAASAPLMLFVPFWSLAGEALIQTAQKIVPGVLDLFWRFLVIGATLFGSGYVLVAYMERTFVYGLGWLTPQQLVDTVAIGQSTPGPVLSTVSAAGYIMTATPGDLWSGVPAAVASTVGVFLPAFVIVLILGRLAPLMRRSALATDFLKGVNAGVIALLIGTFLNLAWATLARPGGGVDWLTLILTGAAFFALERLKWSPLALVPLGAGIGLIRIALGLA